ncbi:MAG: prolipoprotein diacylglyceryl transferase, partial [Rhodospirillales bacterium]|nr:prolipoprotein diacylglyceryl transferase [Rhodospirillales bacterium]
GFYIDDPMEILAVWRGGMSFHGGMAGVFIAIITFSWKRKLPCLALADMVCAVVPVGLFFGRIANFINGELFGRVTDVPWGMVFPRGGPMPRHPSQLYEAGLEGIGLLILTAVLVYGFRALEKRGLVAGCFMIGYGLSRFAVEFVREPDAHLGAVLAGATMGQLLSLPLIALGLWLVHRSRRPG